MSDKQIKLVLLPGMDGTGELFQEIVSELSARYFCQVMRYPNDVPLSYRELQELVIEMTGLEKPFVLIAESFSTPLAIQIAATKPIGLTALVLCAGFATSPPIGWRALCAAVAPLVVRLRIPDGVIRYLLIGCDAPDALLAAVRFAIRSVRPSVLASRLRELLACDVRKELKDVIVPILYVRAKDDRLVSQYFSAELQRLRPDMKMIAFDGPHLILQREPKKAAEIILEFLGTMLR